MYDELAHALGLKEAEVTVFTALIGRGAQPATRIARWCNRSRNTVRGILDKLFYDGFISRTKRGNVHLYAVESAERMSQVLRSKMELLRDEMQGRLQCVEKYAESLKHQKASRRPQITFYEGYDGLMRVYEDTLTSSETLRSWGSFDANQRALPEYFKNYYKRRAKRKIHIRSIHPDTPLARRKSRDNKAELRRTLLVDSGRFSIQPEIQVYDSKVNIVSWREKLGIIIENDEIAEAMKQIFDLCFNADKNK
jgi:predicted transcriptional regulator